MPFQEMDQELGPEALEQRKKLLAALPLRLSSKTLCNKTARHGIINLEGREFHDHQLLAVANFLKVDRTLGWEEKKVAMLFSHDAGLGKTVMAQAILGGIWRFVPHPSRFKNLLIVPANVVLKWHATTDGRLGGWTVLHGEQVFCPLSQSDITIEKLERANIVIVSPGLLVQALKKSHWLNPEASSYVTKLGKIKSKSGIVRGRAPPLPPPPPPPPPVVPPPAPIASSDVARLVENANVHLANQAANAAHAAEIERLKDLEAAKPPPELHPLFAYNQTNDGTKRWSLVVIDEAHEHTAVDDTHWHAYAIREFTKQATFVAALTATPVQHKVQEMPGLCRLMDVPEEWMHTQRYWCIKGGSAKTLRKSTSTSFFDGFVDRVSEETIVQKNLMVGKVVHRVFFAPWIGRLPSGEYEEDAIASHNAFLNAAKQENLANMSANVRKKSTASLWQAWHAMLHFSWDCTLGMHSASAFKDDPSLYDVSLSKPSAAVILLHRVIRSRQQAGRGRITIFSDSVVHLTIALNYLRSRDDCGQLLLYDGSLSKVQREKVIEAFLSPQEPKGVLGISKAGSHAIDLCPGCEVMIMFGDVPWSSEVVAQARARIRRMEKQREPCEYIDLVPTNGVVAVKLLAHEDKKQRLVPALKDSDFSNFEKDKELKNTVFLRGSLTDQLALADSDGNYVVNLDQWRLLSQWQARRAAWDTALLGPFLEPQPAETMLPKPELPEDVELPPVAFPVAGFDESMYIVAPKDSDSEKDVIELSSCDDEEEDEAVNSELESSDAVEVGYQKSVIVHEKAKAALKRAREESNQTKRERRLSILQLSRISSDSDSE